MLSSNKAVKRTRPGNDSDVRTIRQIGTLKQLWLIC